MLSESRRELKVHSSQQALVEGLLSPRPWDNCGVGRATEGKVLPWSISWPWGQTHRWLSLVEGQMELYVFVCAGDKGKEKADN